MRNNSTRLKGKEKTSTSQYQSFEHNGIETSKGCKALKRKKAVHTSCRHGIRRICKVYTKGRPAGKLT